MFLGICVWGLLVTQPMASADTIDGRQARRMEERVSKKAPTYREAAAEIEQILATIDEETDVDIDELAARVERAAELIRFCSEKLRSAESRVEKVTQELARETPARDSEEESED